MNEKRDKLIVETLGGCWHECGKPPYCACPKCGETNTDLQGYYIDPASLNIDLSTPNGFFWVWNRAKQKEWWGEFVIKWMGTNICICGEDYHLFIDELFINPDRFADALAEFLEGRK